MYAAWLILNKLNNFSCLLMVLLNGIEWFLISCLLFLFFFFAVILFRFALNDLWGHNIKLPSMSKYHSLKKVKHGIKKKFAKLLFTVNWADKRSVGVCVGSFHTGTHTHRLKGDKTLCFVFFFSFCFVFAFLVSWHWWSTTEMDVINPNLFVCVNITNSLVTNGM